MDRYDPSLDDAPIVSRSSAMIALLGAASAAAAHAGRVLITGETGVGKDRLARHLHATSPRRSKPFVAINCAAVVDTLLESELFGHTRGSFTGAYCDHAGKLVGADGGTVFLDEVGDMSSRMQALLLRFVESGEVQPVGSVRVRNPRVDVRVFAATTRDLPRMVTAGRFRSDLLYRLDVVHLHVPPLRDRPDDIRPLFSQFAARLDPTLSLTDAAWREVERYPWPGNVRELQNVVERIVATTDVRPITPSDLPPPIGRRTNGEAIELLNGHPLAEEVSRRLAAGTASFWDDVYRPFMDHDLTRADVRQIIAPALRAGDDAELVNTFRIRPREYRRFFKFLVRCGCRAEV